jgi:protein phosphatase
MVGTVDLIQKRVGASDGSNPPRILEEAIEFASNAIYQRAQTRPEQAGMGSTCVVAWVSGYRLYTASVGDSRLYLMRGGHIQQLSIDHTWIQEALERGLLKPEEAEGHPNTHVIRRYLGSPNPPQVDFRLRLTEEQGSIQATQNQGLALQPDDRVLLCSDGLTDLVSAEEILETFERAGSIGAAVEALINLANQRGGHDNITLIAFHATPEAVAAAQAIPVMAAVEAAAPAGATVPVAVKRTKKRALSPTLAGCLGAAAMLVLVAVLVGGYLFYKGTLGAPLQTLTPTPPLTLEAPGAIPGLPSPTPGGPTPRFTRTPTPGGMPGVLRPTLTPWPTNTTGPAG